MSFVTLSPNMSLTIPVTGQETGPNWANDLNNSLLVIDAHTHAAGSGVPITPDGLNINADLPLQLNNITNARSLRFNNYPSLGPFAPTAADVGALFEIAGELNYADGIGNIVPITKLGFVNSGPGSISGLTGFPNASASYIGASGTFVWQQGVNIAANMDSATLILRYPGSYPTPTGNYIAIQAPSSLATGFAFTLPATLPPANNSLLTSNTVGNISYTSFDQVGQGMTSVGANAIHDSRTTAVGATVGIGGIAVSASCAGFNFSGLGPFDIPNLSVTITTTGRPIFVGLIPDGSGSFSSISISRGSSVTSGSIQILRGATIIVRDDLNVSAFTTNPIGYKIPPGAVNGIDFSPAGTYTYKARIAGGDVGEGGGVFFTRIVAYEL